MPGKGQQYNCCPNISNAGVNKSYKHCLDSPHGSLGLS